ncbi:MAG: hypothetical protein H6506_05095 [Calditrichaeota bacterium]|nr:hypothetical protein [Calditrichota bacterium]MCB9392012.1 hypothetical protein [Calditrichota bacterium]
MNRTSFYSVRRHEGGYILVSMMALIAALLGTGLAFMQWATDEVLDVKNQEAGMKAYYLAQTGIIESGLNYMDKQQLSLLPGSEISPPGNSAIVPGVGRYDSVLIAPVPFGLNDADIFSFSPKYRISAVGTVVVPISEEEERIVKRKAVLYIQVRSFVDYMYLTNFETSITFPGDIVRFFGRDTLWGRTHSNDWIATQNVGGLPVFFDIVSTTMPSFRPGSPQPAGQFRGGDPIFNAPPVLLPELADPIRDGAAAQGHFFSMDGMEWRCEINGLSAIFYYYEEGTEFDPLNPPPSINVDCAATPKPCVFVDGKLDLKGVMTPANGGITIGCSENIRLIDNLMLQGTHPTSGALPAAALGPSGSIIGVVGEKWIYIANTWENGRENQAQGSDIILTAAIVALRGSFQLEQMNDIGDNYICACQPDERGEIIMTGSITQWNRGYVHRSNRGGTGYNKVYHYDSRFKTRRPPCFLDATDDEGRAIFNIVQWGQASEASTDVNADIPRRVKYN